MATDPRKRQKKLERRNAKRQDKKHKIARAQPAGLADRITAAAKFPPLDAWVADVFYTEGIGQILFSRELPDHTVAVSVFLVDRYCLGVKDAFAQVLTRSAYDSEFVHNMRKQFPASNVSPSCARKVVEAAVAYAGNLGLAPHPDYHKAKLLFGAVDAGECTEEFEFGKDGKPFFVAGPNDSLQRSRQIIGVLTRKCGPDGFNFAVPFARPEELLPGAGQQEEPANLIDHDEEETPDES